MIIVQVFIGTEFFLGAMRHCVKWHARKNEKRRFHAMFDGDRGDAHQAVRIRTFCIASSLLPAGAPPASTGRRKNRCKHLGIGQASCL
jgi:hypothetical protein